MKIIFTIILIFIYSIAAAQSGDSLMYNLGEKIAVYKSKNAQSFVIKKNDKVKFKNLKFVLRVWGYLQVLDEKNKLFYIDQNGNKQQKTSINIGGCGTVEHFICEIKEINDMYIITKDETFYNSQQEETIEIIDTIKKEGINKLYFINRSQKIQYNANDFVFSFANVFPNAVIIENEMGQGIFHKGVLKMYDEVIETKNWVTKVRIANHLGYYNITEIKYTTLNDFTFGLARFSIDNNLHGYVDIYGNEYYD